MRNTRKDLARHKDSDTELRHQHTSEASSSATRWPTEGRVCGGRHQPADARHPVDAKKDYRSSKHNGSLASSPTVVNRDQTDSGQGLGSRWGLTPSGTDGVIATGAARLRSSEGAPTWDARRSLSRDTKGSLERRVADKAAADAEARSALKAAVDAEARSVQDAAISQLRSQVAQIRELVIDRSRIEEPPTQQRPVARSSSPLRMIGVDSVGSAALDARTSLPARSIMEGRRRQGVSPQPSWQNSGVASPVLGVGYGIPAASSTGDTRVLSRGAHAQSTSAIPVAVGGACMAGVSCSAGNTAIGRSWGQLLR